MALRFSLLDTALHDRTGFQSGSPVLDAYLQRQASQHQRDGIATTHVLSDATEPKRVLGFCSLAAAQLHPQQLKPADRKRLPRFPVSAVRIARLAVSIHEHGKGRGRLLLGHAVNCSLALRDTLGVCVLVVDAKDDSAAGFYSAYGLRETDSDAHTLYLPLGTP